MAGEKEKRRMQSPKKKKQYLTSSHAFFEQGHSLPVRITRAINSNNGKENSYEIGFDDKL